MELWKDILNNKLKETGIKHISLGVDDLKELLDTISYRTLEKIKDIIMDSSLEDEDCFMRIERIVRSFEELGSPCGSRHDF